MMTAVLILNYNNADDTINCIRSIERFNTSPIKYVVVDNGSTRPGTVEAIDTFLREQFPEAYQQRHIDTFPKEKLRHSNLLLNPVNSGYAVGNNKGLDWVFQDSDISGVLLLNNDILFKEDILPRLQEDSRTLERCGVITPLIYQKDGESVDSCCARKFVSNWRIMVPFALHNRDLFGWITRNSARQTVLPERIRENRAPFPVDYPSGSCLYIDKDLFQSIGAFDPRTFLYYEEIILYKKLEAIGRQSYCDPSISVIHLGGSSTRMSDNSFLQQCNLDSADIFLRQYGKMTLPQRLAWAMIRKSWELRLWLKKRLRRESR